MAQYFLVKEKDLLEILCEENFVQTEEKTKRIRRIRIGFMNFKKYQTFWFQKNIYQTLKIKRWLNLIMFEFIFSSKILCLSDITNSLVGFNQPWLVLRTEGVGFEPTEALTSLVFKTSALNRSTTPPNFTILIVPLSWLAYLLEVFNLKSFLYIFL